MFAKEFLPKTLSPVANEERSPHLMECGGPPFFQGARVKVDQSLGDLLKREPETNDGDPEPAKARKLVCGKLARLMLGDGQTHRKLVALHANPAEAHKFLKMLLKGIGTSLKANPRTDPKTSSVLITHKDMALSFALKPKFRKHLMHFLKQC